MKKIWIAYIKGVTKEQFYDNTFMSFECKRKYGKDVDLMAMYYCKKDLLEDMQDLQKVCPNMTYEVE